MKRTSLTLAIICLTSMAFAQKASYKINTQSSTIKWNAKKVVGGHEGTINLQDGIIQIDKGKITSGNFTIDMNSLACTDAPKLTGHLKNEDFFNVPSYPTTKFVISKVDNSKGNPIITGNLTIKNKTKSISFPAKVTTTADGLSAEAKGVKVNRLDFDIQYRSASFFSDLGNKAIEDEFTLDIQIRATK
ncbi:YceI family protein [Sphingobacterium sp.]|uniref:YceI family protein n=1 Tax=Sphingobacterium sp. TaxID=341027 RepID=UPI002FD910D5